MGDAPQELPLKAEEEFNSPDHAVVTLQPPIVRNHKWWLRMVIYTIFVIFGQSGATLLVGLYYKKGGKSIWLAAIMETIGFPILIPFSLYLSPPKQPLNNSTPTDTPSALILATVYISLGLIHSIDNMLYSIGVSYLPVSTFSLISSTQLAFNAFFSFFLNAQKFTPPILNSLVLLTISSALLVFQSDSKNPAGLSRRKYLMGFSCTIAASALYSLLLSLTQLFFCKVLKKETSAVVLNTIICQSLVATCVSTTALLTSCEWNGLGREMEKFELGKESYVMVLVSIAVAWQVFSIGAVGLIFEVSSLFSNVISTLALPIVPVMAVIFFHDKLNGIKVVAMLLAVWGFISYIYQHYLDEYKFKTDNENVNQVSEASLTERC